MVAVGCQLFAQPIKYQEGSKIYDKVEKKPEFPGGQEELKKYTSRPIDNVLRDYFCDVLLSFVVEKDGTLTKVKVLIPSNDRECTEEAVKLLKHSPKWSPGLVDGKPVRVRLTLPVYLNYIGPEFTKTTPPAKNIIYTNVEEVPEFIGGMDAFRDYIKSNIKYPAIAIKDGTEGNVVISFIVERNGKLTQIKVSRGIGDGCDEEAMRLIRKTSKKWVPDRQRNAAVRTQFSVKVTFDLSGNR